MQLPRLWWNHQIYWTYRKIIALLSIRSSEAHLESPWSCASPIVNAPATVATDKTLNSATAKDWFDNIPLGDCTIV
ncbi:MAG: hypothetical protein WAM42_20685 [Candidatus Nitrosopolaris sp.]